MAYARISITLPEEVLAAADRRAKELGRSRSWVIAESLRRSAAAAPASTPPGGVREVGPTYQIRSGLGEQREAQLRADLELTPEQRVIEAERTATAAARSAGHWTGILAFDRFEDYLDWKRREAAVA